MHFPTNVSIRREVVSKAEATVITVQKAQLKVNQEDFDDILASGSVQNMLRFMQNKNIANREESGFRFEDIYFMCKDKTFFLEGL